MGAPTGSVELEHGLVSDQRCGRDTRLIWAATTHPGLRRDANQDCYRIRRSLFVVCDGMGGHKGGEIASSVAAEAMAACGDGEWATEAGLTRAVGAANSAVLAVAAERPELRGLGTTVVCVALCVVDEAVQLVGLNVGDSRAYVLGEGALTQLSRDHSVVQELIDTGSLTREAALTHKDRSVLTQAIGMPEPSTPVVWRRRPRSGMRLLLSTDGIHRVIDQSRIRDELGMGSPARAAKALAVAALEAGAPDNMALIVIDVESAASGVTGDQADRTVERPGKGTDR